MSRIVKPGLYRAGSGFRRAGDPGEAGGTGGSWEFFRGQRPANMYLWGSNVSNNFSQASFFPAAAGKQDRIRTIPHIFTREGTINLMGWWPGSAVGGAGAALRWGIWKDDGAGGLGELIFDSGSVDAWNDPAGGADISWTTKNVNESVEAMTIYHAGWKFNDALANGNKQLGYFSTNDGGGVLGFLNGAQHQPADPVNYPLGNQLNVFRHNGWIVVDAYANDFTSNPAGQTVVTEFGASDPGGWAGRYLTFTYTFTPA